VLVGMLFAGFEAAPAPIDDQSAPEETPEG
jgi:hypothetical protein